MFLLTSAFIIMHVKSAWVLRKCCGSNEQDIFKNGGDVNALIWFVSIMDLVHKLCLLVCSYFSLVPWQHYISNRTNKVFSASQWKGTMEIQVTIVFFILLKGKERLSFIVLYKSILSPWNIIIRTAKLKGFSQFHPPIKC